MEVFVLKALEKLRGESSRRDTEFRESCDFVIRTIQENSQRPNRVPDDGDADKYWMPFQLACEVKNSKMRAQALDSIEKMIAFSYLRGHARMKSASGGVEKPLIDIVIETICSCRDDSADAVQLQVVKALNTAVASSHVAVHEGSLLLAVRAVYHVCLGSRNPVNRNTARGTLRQMLAIVFVRMEKWHMENGKELAAAAASAAPPTPTPAPTPAVPSQPPPPAAPVKVKKVVTVTRMKKVSKEVTETVPVDPSAFWPYMYPSAAASLGYILQGSTVRSKTVEEEVPEEVQEEIEVEEMPVVATPVKASPTPSPEASHADSSLGLGGLPSQAHKDAFVVFRSLCRLTAVADEEGMPQPSSGGGLFGLGGSAARPAPPPAPSGGGDRPVQVLSDEALLANPVALQSKLLSLELVVGLLESAGPALQNGPKFIATIKTYLCVGLLKNFVSTIPALSALSLKAFMALVKGFKRHVAAEVEVFVSTIFLRMLTSSTANAEQKLSVLTAFRSMVSDPGSVLELFLNYDCTEGRQNVFEDSVRTLAGIAQGQGRAGEAIAAMAMAAQQAQAAAAQSDGVVQAPKLPPGMEAGAIKAAALQALSSIIQSMVVLGDAAAKQMAEAEGGLKLIEAGAALAAPPSAPPAAAAKGQAKEDEEDDDEDLTSVGAAAATAGSASGAAGPMSPAGATSSSSSSALARSYEEQKRKRLMMEKAAVKFAMSPKKGVAFMQAHGLCGTTPDAIAACFHEYGSAEGGVLDKTAIGEYLGEEKPAHIAVLHAYTDQLDFTGLTFDDAIRKYLAGFRIPGEAQKIDRIMEKLAERFCKCNPNVFPTADTAFILAYSIIMLHTDAHNPNIKPEKKMSKDNFLRNNRGIANGADLPAEFLGAIYDSIVSRPFTLREDDAIRHKQAAVAVATDERARRELQLKERADILAQGTAQLSSLTTARRHAGEGGAGDVTLAGGLSLSSYVSVADVQLADHVRPMFEVVWGAMLAVWSINFEQAGDSQEEGWTVNACLAGFNQAIHTAGALRMESERDTLVASLCKFTSLALGEAAAGSVGGGPGSVRELRGKHVAAVRAVLSMGFHEGNTLGPAWGHVLSVVSAVSRLQNIAMGGKEDEAFFPALPKPREPVVGANTSAARREAERVQKLVEKDQQTDRLNAALLTAHVPEADISRLFARSHALSSTAIVDFVTQLGAVSLYELASCTAAPQEFPAIGKGLDGSGSAATAMGLTKPRIFSLQKVVEVADFNMNVRPRMAWARMWDSLSKFFAAVCTSSSTPVAMFAIDSLKQLSLKFCAKPELKSFHFQTKFMAPFVAIMEATASGATVAGVAAAAKAGKQGARRSQSEIRELVLHVCANIIRARSANIRSGWRSFLAVYAAAASDADELLVSLSFSMAHEVVDTHFQAVVAAGAFTDAVKCMVAFGSNPHALFALRAIDHVCSLGAHLARGDVPIEGDPSATPIAVPSVDGTASVPASPLRGGAPGPDASTLPAAALAAGSWYDLDGAENSDVVDDSHDKSLLSRGDAAPLRVGGRGYSMENFDGAEGGGAGGGGPASGAEGGGGRAEDEAELDPDADASEEARAAEDAMDMAMLAADSAPGGKIRRFSDGTAHLQLWFPLLTGLARLISTDTRLPVRMRSLHALFALLRRYGPGFDSRLWSIIYGGVLMPIFDDVFHVLHEGDSDAVAGLGRGSGGADMEGGEAAPHYSLAEFSSRAIPAPAAATATNLRNVWPGAPPANAARPGASSTGGTLEEHEWLRTTCMPALSSLVRLQSRFFTRLGFLLPGLLRLIERCVDQEIEGLARVGVASLRLLLAEAGPRFSAATWDVVTASLGRMFLATTPAALLDCRVALLGEEQPEDLDGQGSGDLEAEAEAQAAAAASLEEKTKAPTPVAEPAKPVIPPALAVWSTPSSSLPVPVDTPYGPGSLLSLPAPLAARPVATVKLPWATVYIHVPTQVAAVRASLGLPAAGVEAVAAASSSPSAASAATPAATAQAPARLTALPFSSSKVVTQCVVQLELIGAVGVLCDAQLGSLSLGHVESLLGLLQSSASFARRFNADRVLRRALWEWGFMRFAKHNKLPSLLRQETAATRQLLALALRLYTYDVERSSGSSPSAAGGSGSRPWAHMSIGHLRQLIKGILARYTQLAVDVQRAQVLALPPHMHASLQFTYSGGSAWGGYTPERDALLVGEHSRDLFREAAAYGPMVLQLLEGLLAFNDEQFRANLYWLYPLLTGLISCGSVEIRQMLSQVFTVRLRKLLPVDALAVPPAEAGGKDSAPSSAAAAAGAQARAAPSASLGEHVDSSSKAGVVVEIEQDGEGGSASAAGSVDAGGKASKKEKKQKKAKI